MSKNFKKLNFPSTFPVLPQLLCVLTGYDGGFPRRGSDGDRNVDGVAVETGLAGPGGVLLVVSILLLFSKTQATLH